MILGSLEKMSDNVDVDVDADVEVDEHLVIVQQQKKTIQEQQEEIDTLHATIDDLSRSIVPHKREKGLAVQEAVAEAQRQAAAEAAAVEETNKKRAAGLNEQIAQLRDEVESLPAKLEAARAEERAKAEEEKQNELEAVRSELNSKIQRQVELLEMSRVQDEAVVAAHRRLTSEQLVLLEKQEHKQRIEILLQSLRVAEALRRAWLMFVSGTAVKLLHRWNRKIRRASSQSHSPSPTNDSSESSPSPNMSQLLEDESTTRRRLAAAFFSSSFAASNRADDELALAMEEAAEREALDDESAARCLVMKTLLEEEIGRDRIAAQHQDGVVGLAENSEHELHERIQAAAVAQVSPFRGQSSAGGSSPVKSADGDSDLPAANGNNENNNMRLEAY